MRRLALVPTLIAALLLPSAAHALGLGEIEIQSALNQRLDAEIPLRGVPSGQGDDIEVSLASEEAFQNVGLDRPFALTRLRFTVKQRDRGAHYVHITSPESIVEPFLSFLVEVDWSGGNLLREYTVLLDPPVFTSEDESEQPGESTEPGESTDTARTAQASDGAGVTGEIERDTDSADTGTDASEEDTGEASGSGRTRSDDGDDKPVFLEVEEREEREEREARDERARAETERANQSADGGSGSRSAGVPEQYGPVGEGETLWSIASRLKSGDMTVQQMMVALLRYNPDAFRGKNINRLKQGYVLRVPDSDRVLEVSAQRALAEVREQNGVWRELQEGSRTETSVAASEQGSGDAGATGESGAGSDDAELSIVGADEGGASSDEAASATGSSSAEESEKLQLAREQLESVRLEKEELESRVDKLEQTVSKMEKLLEVRDERLSALQEELRKLEGRQVKDQDADTGADDAAQTDVAAAEDADGEAVDAGDADDDEDMVAAADGDTGGDDTAGGEASGATGTDGGANGGESTAASVGESADATASADTAGSGDGATESTSASASVDEQAGDSDARQDDRINEADRGVQTTRTRDPEETWLDKVNGTVATVTGVLAGLGGGLLGGPVGLGLAAAGLLLGGAVILMRRRREADESAELDGFGPVEPDADPAPFDANFSGRFEAPGTNIDEDEDEARPASAEDAHSALMAEEFDVSSLDEEDPSDSATSDAPGETARGNDDEEAEYDDTVAEADVYLAYGLHQQAEDLLRLALREQSDNATYYEKLFETLYASGKTEAFIEEAGTVRSLVAGPESRLWQRVLAMGRDLAPRHELFAEGETADTTEDVKPSTPVGMDVELDDADGDMDVGPGDEPGSTGGGNTGSAAEQDDGFSSTMMLDSSDFETADGNAGLVGPDDDRSGAGGADNGESAPSGDTNEDEDLEFDLGDFEDLTGDSGKPEASTPEKSGEGSDGLEFDLDDDNAAESGDSARTGAGDADGALDFDLDFGMPETPEEGQATNGMADTGDSATPASAGSDDSDLDFDFDLEETATGSSPGTAGTDDSKAAESTGSADTGSDDAELDFDFDLEETATGSSPGTAGTDDSKAAESTGSADTGSDDAELDFDFDLEETATESSPGTAGTDDSKAEEPAPAESADDDALEIGDLELGDLEIGDQESLETETDPVTGAGDSAPPHGSERVGTGEDGDAGTSEFDLADPETGLDGGSEESSPDRTAGAPGSGDHGAAADDDAFDLSELDSGGGAATDDHGEFNLDDLGAAEPEASETSGVVESTSAGEPAESAAPPGAATASSDAAGAPDEDDEFDTMLDLARAYIDMGDPESATNALEEVASSGSQRQRGEAESLLENVC